MKLKVAFLSAFVLNVIVLTGSARAGVISVVDLLNHPENFSMDQPVELNCYFSRESKAWLHVIEDSAKYVGLFVFDEKDSLIFHEKVTFPYLFAPRTLQKEIRTFRKGDRVIITGRCFKHKAAGKDAVGIMIESIRQAEESASFDRADISRGASWTGSFYPFQEEPESGSHETYTIRLGDNTLSGLRWGQTYTLNGVEFIVTPDETIKERGKTE